MQNLQLYIKRAADAADIRWMLVWAIVVGVVGALATAGFREGIDLLQVAFGSKPGDFVAMANALPWPVRAALPAVGGVIAGVCLSIASRRKSAHGSDYMEALETGEGIVPVWASLWRSLSSLFTIATGGAIGREGSMVQLAALSSSMLGRAFRLDSNKLRVLV